MSPSVEPFNEAKYKALMDGLEFAETWFSEIINATGYFRLEAEYYTAETVDVERTFRGEDVILKVQYGTSKGHGRYCLRSGGACG